MAEKRKTTTSNTANGARKPSSGTRTRAEAKALQMKKRKARRRRRIAIFALEIIALLVLLAGFYVVSKWDKIKHVDLDKEDIVVNTDMDSSYVEEISKGYTNIGIFGVDGEGYNCDVVIICSINNDTGEIRMASVFRDTIMQMEDDSFDKINSAINDGEYGTSVMNTLNKNLDLNIDNFVVVNWQAVALGINILGGVDVNITDAMMGEINGYITDTVAHAGGLGTVQLTHSGMQHLDGVQAVAYCRLRHQDSDIGRTARQREVIGQLFTKAKSASMSVLNSVVNNVFPLVTTSLELDDLWGMALGIGNYNMGETVGFPFYNHSVATWRKPEDWPMFPMNLQNNVSQLHDFLYESEDYTPSATVQQISAMIQNETNNMGLAVPETTAFSTEGAQ
ncbi:MAG: LCP family protein [Lachnospiraceae bacterium]|nr:LCP family protein [Lachnospiraceae bacterium]